MANRTTDQSETRIPGAFDWDLAHPFAWARWTAPIRLSPYEGYGRERCCRVTRGITVLLPPHVLTGLPAAGAIPRRTPMGDRTTTRAWPQNRRRTVTLWMHWAICAERAQQMLHTVSWGPPAGRSVSGSVLAAHRAGGFWSTTLLPHLGLNFARRSAAASKQGHG
jgi:hypothetical protein